MKATLPVLLLAVVLPVVCSAQDDAAARIPQLVDQLGSAKFGQREQAQAELTAIGAAALPALIGRIDDRDPEIRERARSIVRGIMPDLTPVVLDALKRILQDAKGEERLECVSVLFGMPDAGFDKLLPALVSEKGRILPAVLAILPKAPPAVRKRVIRYVRSLEGVELPADVERLLLALDGKWAELLAQGEAAYPQVTACLKGEIAADTRALRELVRRIRFRHRERGKVLGPALLAALPRADRELCGEIARALVTLDHEPGKATPFLLKVWPGRPDIPLAYGITNAIDQVLALEVKDPKRDGAKIARWQLRAIGLLGRRGARYIDHCDELTGRLSDGADMQDAAEYLANIGPAAITVALRGHDRGGNARAYARTVTFLEEEATLGSREADAKVTRRILPTLMYEGVYNLEKRPGMADLEADIEALRLEAKPVLQAKYADTLAVIRAMTGKDKITVVARLVAARDPGRTWGLMQAAVRLGLSKEAAARCAAMLRQEREQGLDDIGRRMQGIRSLVYCLLWLKEDADPVVQELLAWMDLSEEGLSAGQRKSVQALKMACWDQLEYLAPYSADALRRVVAKVEADSGWVSSLAYVAAYGHPLGNGDVEPLARAFAAAFSVKLKGTEQVSVWHAMFGARGLAMLGKRAAAVAPIVERAVKEKEPPISTLARAALVHITGEAEPHIAEIRKRLTVERITEDIRYKRGLPVDRGHSAYAAELLGVLGKDMGPALEHLCFEPALRHERRQEMLRALYAVDGGGERAARVVGRVLDCPLVLEEWLTREFTLRVLREFGVSSPALRKKVEALVLSAPSYKERAIAREIVKNGFKPLPLDVDDVDR